MNLIEALRTGRPLRRPIPKHLGSHGDGWLGHEYVKMMATGGPLNDTFSGLNSTALRMTEDDLMAEDWECEPKTVTITVADLAEAWKRAVARYPLRDGPYCVDVARELGLVDEESK